MFMNALTIASASLVALTSAAAIPRQIVVPHDTPDYHLLTNVTSGNASYDGLYVQGFHTGAGLSATVLTANETTGIFGFLGDSVQYFEESIEFAFVLENSTTSEGPAGYNYLGINAGDGTPGFSIDNSTSQILFDGYPTFGSFAACYVAGIPPYTSVGPEIQVLWRPSDVTADPACADIDLYAVYANMTTA